MYSPLYLSLMPLCFPFLPFFLLLLPWSHPPLPFFVFLALFSFFFIPPPPPVLPPYFGLLLRFPPSFFFYFLFPNRLYSFPIPFHCPSPSFHSIFNCTLPPSSFHWPPPLNPLSLPASLPPFIAVVPSSFLSLPLLHPSMHPSFSPFLNPTFSLPLLPCISPSPSLPFPPQPLLPLLVSLYPIHRLATCSDGDRFED